MRFYEREDSNCSIQCGRKASNIHHSKVRKAKDFHDRIVEVDVFLKLDNVIHTIKDKIAEIRVHVPRHYFFVKNNH
jgi:hypothetical protein